MSLGIKRGGTNQEEVRQIAREEDAKQIVDNGTYTPNIKYVIIDADGKKKIFQAKDFNGDGSDFTVTSVTDFSEIDSKFDNLTDPTGEDDYRNSLGLEKVGIDILKTDGSIEINLTGGELYYYNEGTRNREKLIYTEANPVTVKKYSWDGTDLGDQNTWDFSSVDDETGVVTTETESTRYTSPYLFLRENGGVIEFAQLISNANYSSQNIAQRQETALPNSFPAFLNGWKLVGKLLARTSENNLNRDRVYRMNSLRNENKLVAVGTTSEAESLYKGSENTISSLQLVASPQDGWKYFVKETGLDYTFNVSATNGITANDGTTGRWIQSVILTPTIEAGVDPIDWMLGNHPENMAVIYYNNSRANIRNLTWDQALYTGRIYILGNDTPNTSTNGTYSIPPVSTAIVEQQGSDLKILVFQDQKIVTYPDMASAIGKTHTFQESLAIGKGGGFWINISGANNSVFNGVEDVNWTNAYNPDHSHEVLEKITLNNPQWSSGTSAASTITIEFVDIDGNIYPNGTFLATGTLNPWTGSSTPIVLNNTVWNGTIGVGHNKGGAIDFTWNPASTSTPNGISAINVSGNTAQGTTSYAIEFEDTNYSVSGSDVTGLVSTDWTVRGAEPTINVDDVSLWSATEENIELGALRKVLTSPITIFGRIVDDATADGGTSPAGGKWEDITEQVTEAITVVDLSSRTDGGNYFATYGDQKTYIFTGANTQTVLFPTVGVTNANQSTIIQNKSTSVLTVDGKDIEPDSGAYITSTGTERTVTVFGSGSGGESLELGQSTFTYNAAGTILGGSSGAVYNTNTYSFEIEKDGEYWFDCSCLQDVTLSGGSSTSPVGGQFYIGSTSGASDIAILQMGSVKIGYDDDNRDNQDVQTVSDRVKVTLTAGTYYYYMQTASPQGVAGSRQAHNLRGKLNWIGKISGQDFVNKDDVLEIQNDWVEVFNGSATITGNLNWFNVGSPQTVITGEVGDEIIIEFGNGTVDSVSYKFANELASGRRGSNNTRIDAQVLATGQIQLRSSDPGSTGVGSISVRKAGKRILLPDSLTLDPAVVVGDGLALGANNTIVKDASVNSSQDWIERTITGGFYNATADTLPKDSKTRLLTSQNSSAFGFVAGPDMEVGDRALIWNGSDFTITTDIRSVGGGAINLAPKEGVWMYLNSTTDTSSTKWTTQYIPH